MLSFEWRGTHSILCQDARVHAFSNAPTRVGQGALVGPAAPIRNLLFQAEPGELSSPSTAQTYEASCPFSPLPPAPCCRLAIRHSRLIDIACVVLQIRPWPLIAAAPDAPQTRPSPLKTVPSCIVTSTTVRLVRSADKPSGTRFSPTCGSDALGTPWRGSRLFFSS